MCGGLTFTFELTQAGNAKKKNVWVIWGLKKKKITDTSENK